MLFGEANSHCNFQRKRHTKERCTHKNGVELHKIVDKVLDFK